VPRGCYNPPIGGQFQRIGFFHFVENHGLPQESLFAAIRRVPERDLVDSLIVLPETFNLGRFYRDPVELGRFLPTRPFLEWLVDLSGQTGAAFVVGLLEESAESQLPYNSAWLVLPRTPTPILMSRKMEPGPPDLYQAAATPSGRNPISQGGICVYAFVCNDYQRFSTGERMSCATRPTVLCVPACMNSGTFSGPQLNSARGSYLILANCDPNGCGSFIKDRLGHKRGSIGEPGSQCKNAVILRAWADLNLVLTG
jgi:predicted amidohydrolase